MTSPFFPEKETVKRSGGGLKAPRHTFTVSLTHTHARTPLAVFSGITPPLPLGIYTAAAIGLIVTGRDGGLYKRKLTLKMKYGRSAMDLFRRRDTATHHTALR